MAAAGFVTSALPRWVSSTGVGVGVSYILAVPGAGLVTEVTTIMWFVWFTVVAVAVLRRGRRAGTMASTVGASSAVA